MAAGAGRDAATPADATRRTVTLAGNGGTCTPRANRMPLAGNVDPDRAAYRLLALRDGLTVPDPARCALATTSG